MNIEILLEEFKNILLQETRVKNFYDHYIDQLDNKDIKDRLIGIRNDEIVHIKIAEKLIELVS